MESRVTYVVPNGVYVDVGTRAGVEKGDLGRVLRDRREVAQAVVVVVTTETAFLRIANPQSPDPARPGDVVEIRIRDHGNDGVDADETEPSRSRTLRADGDEPFVPLLAQPGARALGLTMSHDVIHGRVTARQIYQQDSEKSADYSISQLASEGSWLRLAGTPWALR